MPSLKHATRRHAGGWMGGCALALLATTLAWSGSAAATDGRTAVGMCIDSTASGARCAWSVNDKGEIDICNKNGCVYCPSATSECEMARSRPKPTHALPAGARVSRPFGEHTVRMLRGVPAIDGVIRPTTKATATRKP